MIIKKHILKLNKKKINQPCKNHAKSIHDYKKVTKQENILWEYPLTKAENHSKAGI